MNNKNWGLDKKVTDDMFKALEGIDPQRNTKDIKDTGHPCPRCKGSGTVWGRCCGGLVNQCGCMGQPVDITCSLCNGTGTIDKPLSEAELLDLVDFLNSQGELDDYMNQQRKEHDQQN